MLLPSIFGERFFDDDFMNVPAFRNQRDGTLMKSDVKDMEDHFELDMDLPGLKKEDVKLKLKNGNLTVEASTSTSKDEKDEDGKYIRRERFQGSCTRSFYVGDRLEQDDIKAKFENGVLKISIPKESSKPELEDNNYIAIEG